MVTADAVFFLVQVSCFIWKGVIQWLVVFFFFFRTHSANLEFSLRVRSLLLIICALHVHNYLSLLPR